MRAGWGAWIGLVIGIAVKSALAVMMIGLTVLLIVLLSSGDFSFAAITPDQLTWVVVGDSSQVAAQLTELGLGPVQLIDADGNLLAEQPAASLNGAGSSR